MTDHMPGAAIRGNFEALIVRCSNLELRVAELEKQIKHLAKCCAKTSPNE